MSKIEVKELTTLSGETELTLGESGKTIAVPSGTTLDIKSGATIANNGTATGFGGGGKILQVVQTTKSDIFSVNNPGTFVDVTGLSASITPSSIDSKILISSTIHGNSTGRYSAFRLMRDSTFVLPPTQAGSRTGITTNFASNQTITDQNYILRNTSFTLLDEPSTLSQINYKIQVASDTRSVGDNFIVYINRTPNDDNAEYTHRAVSNIILMEVSS